MSKLFFKCILLSVFVLSFACRSYAFTFGMGMTGYYGYWKPCFEALLDDYEGDPVRMYGPVISLGFEKFQLTAGFSITPGWLFGEYPEATAKIDGTGSQGDYTITADTALERVEIDVILSFVLTERLRVFLGSKLWGFTLREPENSDNPLQVTSPYSFDENSNFEDGSGGRCITMDLYSLGSGINYSFRLIDALSLSTGIAFNISYAEITEVLYAEETSPGKLNLHSGESLSSAYVYTGVGSNINLNLSYFFSSINTAISLGGRFQVTHFIPDGDAPDLDTDYMAGVVMYAMLYF